jgi:putative oxidoreductase
MEVERMRMQQWILGRTGPKPADVDAGLAVVRVVAGLALAWLHGIGKIPPPDWLVGRAADMGFPAPIVFAWLAAIAEFVGGILLALGLLTRPAALLLIGHFLVVVFLAHAGDPVADRELAALFGAIGVMYLLTGPGRYSLDALIARGRA